MGNLISVEHFISNPKEYNGQRVVTFKDIDLVHGRAKGTARRNFTANKERFIEGADYFIITPQMLEKTGMNEIRTSGIEDVNARGTTFLSETGYLMLVKSFTDDLAWQVQRELVNNYFKKPETIGIWLHSDKIGESTRRLAGKIRKDITAMELLLDIFEKTSFKSEREGCRKAMRLIARDMNTWAKDLAEINLMM